MNNPTPTKRGIELEIGMVDNDNKPIYPKTKNGETSYEKLISERKPNMDLIKPEVINNIVELITTPHTSIESAQRQLNSLLIECKQAIKNIGLNVSKTPWINIDKNEITEDKLIELCVTNKDYYKNATQEIIKVLEDPYDILGAGVLATHIHVSAENDEATFELFKMVSNYSKLLWDNSNNNKQMLMSNGRLRQRNKIVNARKELGHLVGGINPLKIPDNYIDYIYSNFLDNKGNLKTIHNIIALKKPGNEYTVEIRSTDGIHNSEQLNTIVSFTKKLIKDSIYYDKISL